MPINRVLSRKKIFRVAMVTLKSEREVYPTLEEKHSPLDKWTQNWLSSRLWPSVQQTVFYCLFLLAVDLLSVRVLRAATGAIQLAICLGGWDIFWGRRWYDDARWKGLKTGHFHVDDALRTHEFQNFIPGNYHHFAHPFSQFISSPLKQVLCVLVILMLCVLYGVVTHFFALFSE